MDRGSYKDALRVKGIRPIPPVSHLRSSLYVKGEHILSEKMV